MALTYKGSDLTAVTHANIRNWSTDVYFQGNPLLSRLNEQNRVQEYEGLRIQLPLIYRGTGMSGGFDNGGPLPTTMDDPLTAAVFNYVQKYGTIVLPFKELRKQAGPEGVVKLIQTYSDVARMDLIDHIGGDIFDGNQSSSSALNYDGLHLMVDDDNTPKNYGGIATTDVSSWAASNTSYASTAVTLKAFQGWVGDVTIGNDRPTIAVTTQDIFDKFWELCQNDQRFSPAVKAMAGYQYIDVSGVPLFVDRNCQSQTMYLLNEKYIYFFKDPNNNMDFDGFKETVDNKDQVGHLIDVAQLATDNRRMHHRIDSIDASL